MRAACRHLFAFQTWLLAAACQTTLSVLCLVQLASGRAQLAPACWACSPCTSAAKLAHKRHQHNVSCGTFSVRPSVTRRATGMSLCAACRSERQHGSMKARQKAPLVRTAHCCFPSWQMRSFASVMHIHHGDCPSASLQAPWNDKSACIQCGATVLRVVAARARKFCSATAHFHAARHANNQCASQAAHPTSMLQIKVLQYS